MGGSSDSILPFKWRWVFRDTLQYLQMPYAAVVWSLGLLALHNGRPVDVQLEFSNDTHTSCRNANLTIGEDVSDKLIGNALADMTDAVAEEDGRYNTSHWCYMRKRPNLEHETFTRFDDNFFSPYPSLEYFCCKYNTQEQSDQKVICARSHMYDPVWWDVPLGLGILILLFFPLMFLKVSGHVHKKILESSTTQGETSDISETDPNTNSRSESMKIDIPNSLKADHIYENGKSPITATSTILNAFSCLLQTKQSTKSRLAIFTFSVLTLVIPALEFLMYYCFLYDYIVDLANNNITIGFSGLVAGWEANRMKFSVFGGPFIAIGVYLVIGWVFMLTPKMMADQLYIGVIDGDENSKTILNLSLEKKEELGSVRIRKHKNGYIRLFCVQVCHFYMLVNSDLWILIGSIIKIRWCAFVSTLGSYIFIKFIVYTIAVLCIPFYTVACITEILLALVYYLIPMASFMCCVIRGFRIGLRRYVQEECCITFSRIRLVLRLPCCLIIVILLFYYMYVFTVLFFDSFFFLSRILMFTYTAVVAYPRETYGYFMLILVSAYFALEGFFHFGDIYNLMLKFAIKRCKESESLQQYLHRHKDSNEEIIYGISRELFEYLVEQIRPRRVQALHTVIKFVSIVFILSVSIVLMDRLKKFEDLSLLIHVFITIFICALPIIYNLVISKENQKKKIKRKVNKHFKTWIDKTAKSHQTGTIAQNS